MFPSCRFHTLDVLWKHFGNDSLKNNCEHNGSVERALCGDALQLSCWACWQKLHWKQLFIYFYLDFKLLLILVLLFVRYFWVADAEKVPPLCGIRPPLCLFMQERHPSLLVSCVFSLILFTFHSGLHQRTWNRLSSPKPFQLKGVCLFSF